VSDVTLFEQHPANALVHVQRLHRWVRGDWQLLPWLIARRPPGRDGPLERGLRPLARWAVADNLRRSLYLPSLLGLLIGAWATLPAPAPPSRRWPWWRCWRRRRRSRCSARCGAASRADAAAGLGAAGHAARLELARAALEVALLPYQALVTGDAIVRAVWRVYVSRRGLLQWTSAAHTAGSLGDTVSLPTALRFMGGAVALTGGRGGAGAGRAHVAAGGGAAARGLAAGARDRGLDQPLGAAAPRAAHARAAPRPAAAGAPHLALLRRAGGPARPLAAARPPAGGPGPDDGPPHVAHQHRHDAREHARRLRPRLHRGPHAREPGARDARHARPARAPPRGTG
jgi:hypothetical protein